MTSAVTKQFFAPVIKGHDGKINVILSDNSVDLDGEIIGKSFLQKAVDDKGFFPALMDHENKALNLINEWVDKKLVKYTDEDGETHDALMARPKWFPSNPNSVIIRNMVEKDGAPMGVSITAIPTASSEEKRHGKTYKSYTDGKIISCDWVGIPANSHARALALSKSLKLEVDKVDENKLKEFGNELTANISKNFEGLAKQESVDAIQKELDTVKAEMDSIKKSFEATTVQKTTTETAEKKADDRHAELQKKNDLPVSNDGNAVPAVDDNFSPAGFLKAARGATINK